MEIEKILENLGLSDKEAKVYLTLLKAGTISAYGVAVRSELKRPTVYFILDSLVKRGIVYLIPKTKKKVYRATPLEKLVQVAEEKIEKIKERLPEIQALAQNQTEKPQVLYFEGVGGVKELLNYRIKEMKGKETVGFFAKETGDTLKLFDNFDEYNHKLKELGVTARGIAPDDPTIKHFRKVDKEYGREIITLPRNKYSSNIAIEICKDLNFIKIYDFENLQALIIENQPITKTLGQVFELVWDSLRK